MIWSVAALSQKRHRQRRRRKDSLPLKDKRSCRGCRCCSKCLGWDLESGAYFLLVIYMMRSAWAVNNEDKWSARQDSPRELLRQSLGLIALPGLPAATHTHCTRGRVCMVRSLGASKDINKAELVVIHGADVCGSEVKRVKQIFCMATHWTPLTCSGLVMICRPHWFESRDSF